MTPFSLESFTINLLTEALFYDREDGVIGCVSLVDEKGRHERYVATCDPDHDRFLIEEVTEWEDSDEYEGQGPDFVMGVEGKEYGTYGTSDQAAAALLALARDYNFVPIFMVLLEED